MLLLLLLSLGLAGGETPAKLHGDSIWDTRSVVDEASRRQVFAERHGRWPDPKWLAAESPAYSARMDARARELMANVTESQRRWDEWMFLTQARMVPRFTPKQWGLVRGPADVHAELLDRFHAKLRDPGALVDEGMGPELSGVRGPQRASFFEQEHLNYEVLWKLRPLFEEWAGVELEPTSVYGVRIYRQGSTLRDHLDVLETHVISGILHIDSDLDAPFPIQIEDSTGELASVDLKPGDIMLYESAKSFHQRSVPMQGRFYASVFLHYRPVGWNMTREHVRAAIPPWWADGLSERDTPSSPLEPRQVTVTFTHAQGEPGAVVLLWRVPDIDPPRFEPAGDLPTVGASVRVKTFPGHAFVARRVSTGEELASWIIHGGDDGSELVVGGAVNSEL